MTLPRFRVRTLMIATVLIALLLVAPASIRARHRRQSASLHAAQARFWARMAREAGRPGRHAAREAEEYRRAAALHEAQSRAFAGGW